MRKEIKSQEVRDNIFKTELWKLLTSEIYEDEDYFRKLIIANEFVSKELLLFKNDTFNKKREEE